MKFKQGQKLRFISWANGDVLYQLGSLGITAITVVMEDGQMGGVPWAFIESSGPPIKVNLALVEEVALLEEKQC